MEKHRNVHRGGHNRTGRCSDDGDVLGFDELLSACLRGSTATTGLDFGLSVGKKVDIKGWKLVLVLINHQHMVTI